MLEPRLEWGADGPRRQIAQASAKYVVMRGRSEWTAWGVVGNDDCFPLGVFGSEHQARAACQQHHDRSLRLWLKYGCGLHVPKVQEAGA